MAPLRLRGRRSTHPVVAVRVCSSAPSVRLRVHEVLRRAGHDRSFRLRQRRPCQSHTVSWRLGARFRRAGRYRVRVVAADAYGTSRPRSRHVVLD